MKMKRNRVFAKYLLFFTNVTLKIMNDILKTFDSDRLKLSGNF